MSGKAKIAVIGAGWWCTEFHLPDLIKRNDVELVSVCRFGKKELNFVKEKFGFKFASEDYKEALSFDKLDGALISTPHPYHFQCGLYALTKGCHLIIEKPMTTNISDANEIYEKAKNLKKEIIIPYGYNYTNFMKKASELLKEKTIGKIKHISASMSSSTMDLFSGMPLKEAEDHTFQPLASTWSDPKLAGGYGWGQTVHLLGAIFYLINEDPSKVFCANSKTITGVDAANSISVLFENGTTASISGCAYLPKEVEGDHPVDVNFMEIKIHGTKGTLFLDVEPGRERLQIKTENDIYEHDMNGEGAHSYSTTPAINNLINVCLGKNFDNRSDALNGKRTITVLDLMYKSMKSGKAEEI